MIEFKQSEVKVVKPGETIDLNIKDPNQQVKAEKVDKSYNILRPKGPVIFPDGSRWFQDADGQGWHEENSDRMGIRAMPRGMCDPQCISCSFSTFDEPFKKDCEKCGPRLRYIEEQKKKIDKQTKSDLISRQAAVDAFWKLEVELRPSAIDAVLDMLKNLSPAEPEYEELTPEEAAAEIVSGSTMSAWHLVDDVMRLEQMGYVICRKK